jgi:hypothetical protein
VAALFVGCTHGTANYRPQLTVNRSKKNYGKKAVHAGDTIVLRVSFYRKSSSVSATDETHKFKVKRTSGGGSSLFEWIGDEHWGTWPNHLESVPNFGTLTYSDQGLRTRAWVLRWRRVDACQQRP